MRWQKMLHLIDVHCEGEVGKIVTSGFPKIPGNTVLDKINWVNTHENSLRKLLTLEPRGALAGSVNVLLEPTCAQADAAFFVLQADRAHAMSGSNAICVVTALLETGKVEMIEPETIVTLDTAVGLVKAKARCKNGVCESVTLEMTPAYVEVLDGYVNTQQWGDIKYDIGFGGVFYAIVDIDQLGLSIKPADARDLAAAGAELAGIIRETVSVVHPEYPDVKDIAYVMFREGMTDGTFKTCTTLWPGRVDRSPCGTGSNVNLATLHARGLINVGDELTSKSIIGSEFKLSVFAQTTVADKPAIQASVTGRAWIYGTQQIRLDPSDPFPEGFVLTDTWGPLAGEVQ